MACVWPTLPVRRINNLEARLHPSLFAVIPRCLCAFDSCSPGFFPSSLSETSLGEFRLVNGLVDGSASLTICYGLLAGEPVRMEEIIDPRYARDCCPAASRRTSGVLALDVAQTRRLGS